MVVKIVGGGMNKIKVYPVRADIVTFWMNEKGDSTNFDRGKQGSIICFDKRQIWEVYPYKLYSTDDEYWGACEYKNLYIRLAPKIFKRIFGEDIVERAEKGGEE